MPAKGWVQPLERFSERLFEIHGEAFKVAEGGYSGVRQPCRFVCSKGHEIELYAAEQALRHIACKACGYDVLLSHTSYLEKLHAKHGDLYTPLRTLTGGSYQSLYHRCNRHGSLFHDSPQGMLYGSPGCPDCKDDRLVQRGVNRRLTAIEVDRRIKQKHRDRVQRVGPYKGMLVHTEFECHHGHTWTATPDPVSRGSGCPKCNSPLQASKAGVAWVDHMARLLRLKFQHAGNGGEVSLRGASGKRYWVDGYNARKRLVLEYNGDIWHGNPAVFAPDSRPNPYSDLTARQLHERTLAKAADLEASGYTVLSVWESDWLNVSHVGVPAYDSATGPRLAGWHL